MITEKKPVSRVLEVPGLEDVKRSTIVNFRSAENASEMAALCDNDGKKVLEYFNEGRWAEMRASVSNALAGKSPEQKAVERMVAAMKTINPSLSDEQARTIVLGMPNMEAATRVSTEILPAEIDDTYFATKKAEKTDAKNGTENSANTESAASGGSEVGETKKRKK